MAVGLYVVKWRRKRANLPEPEFKAWDVLVVFNICVQAYLVVMPWYPPARGEADISIWYGTYCVAGAAILLICGIYYYFWSQVIPKWKGYELRQELIVLGGGAQKNKICRVPFNELAEWDANHDVTGRLKSSTTRSVEEKRLDSGEEKDAIHNTVEFPV